MNRFLFCLVVLSSMGLGVLITAKGGPAPPQGASAVAYLEGTSYQKSRAYSPAVVTKGGRTIWLAGQYATEDLNGKSLVGDFEGQTRTVFTLMDRTLKRTGGSLRNLVGMTVFINDPRYGDEFVKIRHEMFPEGKLPASTLITVSNFAHPGILLEIQGVAVVSE